MSKITAPPYESPIAEDIDYKSRAARIGSGWLRWLNMAQRILESLQRYGELEYQQPSAGFNLTIPDTAGVMILQPAGALANGTVRLPANPVDKQQVQVSTTQAIAALTVTSSVTTLNPPTTLAAGGGFSYYYRSSNTTWYRLY